MGNDCLKILIELEKVIQDQTIDNAFSVNFGLIA